MASEMINEVLKGEAQVRHNLENANKQAEQIIENAKQKAKDFAFSSKKQAEATASLIVSEARLESDGIRRQALKLAELREKKVIADTEKLYPTAIKKVIDLL